MSVSSDDILRIARALLGDADEAFSRTSIGRSYYAAFHEARGTVERLSLAASQGILGGSHEKLIGAFEGKGRGLAKIAARLRLRKPARQKADYNIDEDITPEEAALHLHHCELLIDDLRRLTKS
ncbi:TPA: hypothetical protein ACV5QX_000864 [Pseudomonas aeruginosa]